MKLAFWRREAEAAPGAEWVWVNRAVAFEMAVEMATWPEPIDVIRDVCGVAPRLYVVIGRAWQALLRAIGDQEPYQQFVVAYWRPSEHPTRGAEIVTPGRPSGWRGLRGGKPLGPYR